AETEIEKIAAIKSVRSLRIKGSINRSGVERCSMAAPSPNEKPIATLAIADDVNSEALSLRGLYSRPALSSRGPNARVSQRPFVRSLVLSGALNARISPCPLCAGEAVNHMLRRIRC